VDPDLVRPPEATQPLGDPARAREQLRWRPQIPFEQTIAEMLQTDLALLADASPGS